MQPTASAVGNKIEDGTSPEWGERKFAAHDIQKGCRPNPGPPDMPILQCLR